MLSISPGPAPAPGHSRTSQILAAQVRLLYANATLGIAVTVIAVPLLGRFEWPAVSHPVIVGWCLCMWAVSVARFVLARRYRAADSSRLNPVKWGDAFALGAALAGAGWGAAGFLLYPDALAYQVYLYFILGGMMLGAASLLAPRPESFCAFMIPTGVAPVVRLVLQGDEAHLSMALLALLFTLATLVTTRRIYLTILSSVSHKIENQNLLEDLQASKDQLEIRVRHRTAELHQAAEQLRAEIKQREQVEEQLLRARKLESLGVLAGGIAHDFNNFLTVVQGNVEMAKLQLAPDEPVRAILDQTSGACQEAAFLSSQLLTFAKGGAPVRRLVSVAELVRNAVHLARAGAQTGMHVNIAADLCCAEADPGQIGQVLHNILLNARQAMPEGGIIEVNAANLITKDAAGTDPWVRISIKDYGCGIPADNLPRIFDPYFTTKPGGQGLGLATAYAIIAKHRGNLSVESQPGFGTTFTIDLPASCQQLASPSLEPAALKSGTGRLLVMDDEEPIRRLLETVLINFGYQVETARDGAEAIALFENAKALGREFDCALLDLTVRGGMGGMEAARKLKEIAPGLKLVVSSGYADAPVVSDFRRYGFDGVLPKPWTIAQIAELFERVLVPDPKRS